MKEQIEAKRYVKVHGNKEEAIAFLKELLAMYENPNNPKTPKVIRRIDKYKTLLAEIENL
tara:strand:- start:697 stop:876 length:180 start_codon:yes stop_codon:yes gene_type:complete